MSLVTDIISATKIIRGESNEKNSFVNLFVLVKTCMQQVERIKGLSGGQKKTLVIDSIHQIIEIDNGPLDMFDEVLKPLVEGMIEEFVEIDKKGFTLKTKKCRGVWEFMCRPCRRSDQT